MSTVVIVVAALVVVASYLLWLAGRLDRLAVRVEAARASLDAQLVRRASAASELATVTAARQPVPAGTPGWVDELADSAAAVLASAAAQPRNDPTGVRTTGADGAGLESAESALTRAIRAAVAAAPDADTVRLVDASTRVRFARQFHNDAVHASLLLRRKRVIRWLRLWGTAKAPAYVEFDDTVG